MSVEENLTALVKELFDWIEHRQPDSLTYKCCCLRGAFERYFYFEAMARPCNLFPLLKFTKPWRDSAKESNLTKTFDYYWKTASEAKLIKKLASIFFPWLRLLNDFYHALISNLFSDKSDQRVEQLAFGFFSINDRFVDFFQPIVSEFKSSACVFFSSRPSLIAEKVKGQGAHLALLPMPKGFSAGLGLSVWHPLFPVYLRLCSFYQQAYLGLQQERPHVLLFAEGTSHYDDLIARAAEQLKIPTIRIQSGRAGVLHSGYRNMCFDVMLCWSDDFVERYQSVSPKPVYHAIGSPLLDDIHHLVKQDCSKEKPFSIVIFTQPVSEHISNQDYLLLIKFAVNLLECGESIELIVRKHPVDKHCGFDDLQQKYPLSISLLNAPKFSLATTLINAQCAVGFFSTTLSEAAACGVIPVILQLEQSQSMYPFPEKHGAAIVVHSPEEAISRILEYRKSPENFDQIKARMEVFSQRFFGMNDGRSKIRMLNLINSYSRSPTHG